MIAQRATILAIQAELTHLEDLGNKRLLEMGHDAFAAYLYGLENASLEANAVATLAKLMGFEETAEAWMTIYQNMKREGR